MGGVCLVVLLAGCQTTKKESSRLLLFPSPPGTPRVQFLTWMTGAEQVEPGRDAFESFVLGEESKLSRSINKPYGLAARDGVVYVCDTKGLSICKLDFRSQTFSVFGMSGPGRLRKPINLAIDPMGYKFVVDPQRKQIVVFGPGDDYVRAFDVPEPCYPVDVAIWKNELYVLDNDDSPRVIVLSRVSGEEVRSFGAPGGDPGQFKKPGSVAFDAEGFLYVSDTHNWRIQKLTRHGDPVWSKGTAGYSLGSFGRPRGLRVGPDDIVYVVDGATELVQMYNTDGEVLMHFGGSGDMPGAMSLPASLTMDATSIPYFKKYIHPDFTAEYLLFVANQYGERLINVYAYGSFPDGYTFGQSEIVDLPMRPMDDGLAPVETPPEDEAEDQEAPKPDADGQG